MALDEAEHVVAEDHWDVLVDAMRHSVQTQRARREVHEAVFVLGRLLAGFALLLAVHVQRE